MIIRPEWDAPHVRCLPRTFCAWPCLLRQVGMVLGSPCDCIMTGITYTNPGSRHPTYIVYSPADDLSDTFEGWATLCRIASVGCSLTRYTPPWRSERRRV